MKRALPLLLTLLAAPAAAQAPLELHWVPLHPSVSDRITILVEGDGCPLISTGTQVEGGRVTVRAFRLATFAPCAPEPWAFEVPLGRLAAGPYAVELRVDDQPTLGRNFAVHPADTTLLYFFPSSAAGQAGFTASVTWSLPGETATHAAYAVETSPQAGYFWFFSPENPEATVKIVDGAAVNGHAWLFLSSLTTLPFTLTLSHCDLGDPPQCKVRSYRYPGGVSPLVVDLQLP